jgi:hypothetical protein
MIIFKKAEGGAVPLQGVRGIGKDHAEVALAIVQLLLLLLLLLLHEPGLVAVVGRQQLAQELVVVLHGSAHVPRIGLP